MKKIVYSLIIIMMSILVVGCSSSKSLIGEYKLIEMQDGDTVYTKEEIDAYDINYILSLKDDKTFTLTIKNDVEKGTYNDKILKTDTKEIRYTLSGDKLILTNDGSKLTFERKN